uniref:Predicted Zn-dependent dipeptidase n=1 Tax=uncultured bacterium pES01019D12 TaxID=355333 RepID=A0EJJ9_9BACT|nr:predicted Zn-dependent dipeptidase [uncultured bacterium pES01019D12]
MLRKILISIITLIIVATFMALVIGPGYLENSLNKVIEHDDYVISDEARALHSTLLAADLHSDTLLWHRNVLDRSDRGHVDLPRLVEGGVAVQVFSTVTKAPKALNYEENTGDSDQITGAVILQRWPIRTWGSLYERARYQAQRLDKAAQRSDGALVFLRTAADLESVLESRAQGIAVTGGLMATEGSHALDGSLENIQNLYNEGFRMMGLHHFFDNKLGGSLHGVSKAGLSDFGHDAVVEMNRLGIMIDVAHSSEAVVDDVLALSTTPLVGIPHRGLKVLVNQPRNISDDHMRRIAAAGGLIGIGYWDGAVCDATPAGVARSIAYAVKLVGEQHVALGSDYDGATSVYFDTSELSALTQALLNEGLSDKQIRAVMGGNQIRFFRKHLPN